MHAPEADSGFQVVPTGPALEGSIDIPDGMALLGETAGNFLFLIPQSLPIYIRKDEYRLFAGCFLILHFSMRYSEHEALDIDHTISPDRIFSI